MLEALKKIISSSDDQAVQLCFDEEKNEFIAFSTEAGVPVDYRIDMNGIIVDSHNPERDT